MKRLERSFVYRSLRTVFSAAPGLAVTMAAAAVAGALLGPGIAYTAMRLADAVVAGATGEAVRWVLFELVLAAALTVLGRLRMDMRALLRSRVSLEARLQVAANAAALELTELEDASVRDRIETARAAELRPLELTTELLTILQSALGLLVYAILLARFGGWALLLLLAVAPGAAAELWSSRIGYSGQVSRRRDGRRLKYLQDLLFSEAHAAENNFLGVGPALLGRARAIGERSFAEERAEWRRSAWVVIACQILPPVLLNGCYLVMALATVEGEMTIGALILYGLSLNAAQNLCQAILISGRGALESWRHVRALYGLFDSARPSGSLLPRAPARGESAPRAEVGLRFENVSFRYPGSEAWALRNLDLEIAPGDFVAVIGGNGCGKSTLLKLITGLYPPTHGRITLDGVDLAEHDPRELRRRLAVVFQDFARYGLTVRENVAVGRSGAAEDPARVLEALRLAGAEEVVRRLPEGLDTELMSALAGGAGLSGGQWQRIALARGFVRDEADFLVLDEPTAALDAESERRLFDHLRALQPKKTIILITHRLSTLRPTDKVVLLERGRRIELDERDPSTGELHRLARVFAEA